MKVRHWSVHISTHIARKQNPANCLVMVCIQKFCHLQNLYESVVWKGNHFVINTDLIQFTCYLNAANGIKTCLVWTKYNDYHFFILQECLWQWKCSLKHKSISCLKNIRRIYLYWIGGLKLWRFVTLLWLDCKVKRWLFHVTRVTEHPSFNPLTQYR